MAPNVCGHSARNSRDSAAGIDLSLLAERSGVRFLTKARDVSLLRNVQTCSVAHPARYSIATGGRELDHSHQSSAEVKNEWSCTSTPRIHLQGVDSAFTLPFRHVKKRKATTSSVHPRGTTRFPQDEFSRNLVFEYFSKICRQNSYFIQI